MKATDADISSSGSVLYSFTDDCKLADCEVSYGGPVYVGNTLQDTVLVCV